MTNLQAGPARSIKRYNLAARDHESLGSVRASRAGDGALAVANFSPPNCAKDCFGEAPKPAREGACAPQKKLPLRFS